MGEKIAVINHIASIAFGTFKGAIVCENKPRYGYTETSADGCIGSDRVIIGGYRKVNNGHVKIDGMTLSHPDLSELNGLFVYILADDWLATGFSIVCKSRPSIGLTNKN